MKIWKCLIVIAILVGLFCVAPVGAASKDVLKIAQWEDMNTLDPGWLTSQDRELTIMRCLYNNLVKYEEGSWDVSPDLAESWEMSADGKAATFKLRKGVKFHKGYGEMTAEDVKFSFERIISETSDSTEKGNWAQLAAVEVIDAYTVKLVFKEFMASLFTSALPGNSGMIVSKKAAEKMGREKFGFNPVGTGPYQFDLWEPKKNVKLSAFDEYWGDKPAIKKLTFIPIVEEASSELALRTGEIDIGRVSLINAKMFDRDPKRNLAVSPALKYWWVGFTVNKPPFDNQKLREACRYAIDVDKILKAAFFDISPRANSILPPGMLGHWKEAPAYQVNLDKAKQLLAEGGKPNGFKADLYIWPDEQVRITAEVVKADLAKIGVDIEIVTKEVGAFNDATTSGEPHMYLSFFSTTIDPSYAFSWFFSGEKWNLSKWANPKYDELCTQGMIEKDPAKRAALYIKAQHEIDRDAWAVWLTNGVRVNVSQANVDMGKLYPDGRLAPWLMKFK